jgi:hypothetical protein
MKDRIRLVMVVAAFLLGVQTALQFVGRPLTGLPMLAVPLLALALAVTGKRRIESLRIGPRSRRGVF